MKILYVVQRYGKDIVGGSEAACRQFAEQLVLAGHEVEVLTSCARSYVTWANEYPVGVEVLNHVTIHRLPVIAPRDPATFGPMDQWLMRGTGHPSMWEHERWARLMGPNLDGLREWLLDNHSRFDVSIFMTYLYSTTTMGMPAIAGRLPVVFQPTAHNEPPLKVPIFETIFRLPDSYLFFTPEERDVVSEKFMFEPCGETVGMGIDLDPAVTDVSRLLQSHQIEPGKYLVYVGRLDPMKGVNELIRFFLEYAHRNDDGIKLVLAGDPIIDIPTHPRIVVTWFLDEGRKHSLIKNSLCLVQPSYFESFSIVLCEAWVQQRPALVQGASPVLAGQAERSSGAISFRGFAEFEQAVLMLAAEPELADQMGHAGRRYVESMYSWETVLDGVTNALATATRNFSDRAVTLRPRD